MAAILNLRNSKWLQKWLICLYSFFRYTGLAFDWKPKNLEILPRFLGEKVSFLVSSFIQNLLGHPVLSSKLLLLSHKIFQPRTHTFWMSAQKTTLLHDVEEWSSEKTEGEKKRHQKRNIVSHFKARKRVHFLGYCSTTTNGGSRAFKTSRDCTLDRGRRHASDIDQHSKQQAFPILLKPSMVPFVLYSL